MTLNEGILAEMLQMKKKEYEGLCWKILTSHTFHLGGLHSQ